KPQARLIKSLNTIHSWALSELPQDINNITNYVERGGSVGIAADEFFMLGMNQIGKAFQTLSNSSTTSKKQIAAGTRILVVANSILIKRLQGTRNISFDDLDGITHIMLCALATGQFSLI